MANEKQAYKEALQDTNALISYALVHRYQTSLLGYEDSGH